MTDDLTTKEAELEKAAGYFKQWIMYGVPGKPLMQPRHRFLLKNSTNRKFLQYEHQGWSGGINLGWTSNAEPSTADKVQHWSFVHSGDEDEPLRYGQKIAICWKDDFIRYGERTTGINLDWSRGPVFEWMLLGGPNGSRVSANEWLAIFNTKSEDGEPLIYFDRSWGGDIGWPSSRTWGDQLRDMGVRLAKETIMDYLKGGSDS